MAHYTRLHPRPTHDNYCSGSLPPTTMPHLPSPAASPVFVKRSISTSLESPHPTKRFKVATSSTLRATSPSMSPCDPPPPLRHSESSIYSLVHDIIRCAKDSRAGDDVQFVVDLTSPGPVTGTHVLDRADVPVTNPYLDALTRPAPRTGVPRSRAAPIPVPNNRVSFPSSSSSLSSSPSSSTYPSIPHPHHSSPSHNAHPPSPSAPSSSSASKMPNEIIKSLDPTQVPIHNPGPPLKTSASSPSPQTNLTLALRRDGSGAQKVEDERCVGGLPRSTSVDHHSESSAAVRSPSSTPTPQPQPQTHRTFTFADIDAMVAQSTARAAELEERAREFVEEARRLRVQGRQLAGLKDFVGGARGVAPRESESGGGRSDVDGEREEREEKQERSGGKRKRGVRVKMEDGV